MRLILLIFVSNLLCVFNAKPDATSSTLNIFRDVSLITTNLNFLTNELNAKNGVQKQAENLNKVFTDFQANTKNFVENIPTESEKVGKDFITDFESYANIIKNKIIKAANSELKSIKKSVDDITNDVTAKFDNTKKLLQEYLNKNIKALTPSSDTPLIDQVFNNIADQSNITKYITTLGTDLSALTKFASDNLVTLQNDLINYAVNEVQFTINTANNLKTEIIKQTQSTITDLTKLATDYVNFYTNYIISANKAYIDLNNTLSIMAFSLTKIMNYMSVIINKSHDAANQVATNDMISGILTDTLTADLNDLIGNFNQAQSINDTVNKVLKNFLTDKNELIVKKIADIIVTLLIDIAKATYKNPAGGASVATTIASTVINSKDNITKLDAQQKALNDKVTKLSKLSAGQAGTALGLIKTSMGDAKDIASNINDLMSQFLKILTRFKEDLKISIFGPDLTNAIFGPDNSLSKLISNLVIEFSNLQRDIDVSQLVGITKNITEKLAIATAVVAGLAGSLALGAKYLNTKNNIKKELKRLGFSDDDIAKNTPTEESFKKIAESFNEIGTAKEANNPERIGIEDFINTAAKELAIDKNALFEKAQGKIIETLKARNFDNNTILQRMNKARSNFNLNQIDMGTVTQVTEKASAKIAELLPSAGAQKPMTLSQINEIRTQRGERPYTAEDIYDLYGVHVNEIEPLNPDIFNDLFSEYAEVRPIEEIAP